MAARSSPTAVVRGWHSGRGLRGSRVSFRERQLASAGQRLRPARLAESHFLDVLCCSPTAARVRQQSAAWGRRRTARLKEPQYFP